jgi:hypothetical protein
LLKKAVGFFSIDIFSNYGKIFYMNESKNILRNFCGRTAQNGDGILSQKEKPDG